MDFHFSQKFILQMELIKGTITKKLLHDFDEDYKFIMRVRLCKYVEILDLEWGNRKNKRFFIWRLITMISVRVKVGSMLSLPSSKTRLYHVQSRLLRKLQWNHPSFQL